MPDFLSIGTKADRNGKNSGQVMIDDFWNDHWFGGPLQNPVYTYEFLKKDGGGYKKDENGYKQIDSETKRDIPNDLTEILQQEYQAQEDGSSHGLIILRNMQSDHSPKYFYDVTWYATDLDQIKSENEEKYNELIKMNNTLVTDDSNYRKWEDFEPYINGWARQIEY